MFYIANSLLYIKSCTLLSYKINKKRSSQSLKENRINKIDKNILSWFDLYNIIGQSNWA